MVFWFDCSLLSFFLSLNYFLNIIFNIFYFSNISFILLYFSFFLSFFIPFLLSHVADRVLGYWLCVRAVPLRWESRVEDIGPPETHWFDIISNGESSPRDHHLNTKTWLLATTNKLQYWTLYAKQLARQEHNPKNQQRGCLK